MILPKLIRGTLQRRYKRFLADVQLADGTGITVHCPNTGAMTGCAEPGWPVWLSASDNPKRKYRHTWELVETPDGSVSVNTGRANALVAEALKAGRVIGEVEHIRPEIKIPEGDGRFDFLVRRGSSDIYIEVKSVTLLVEGDEGAFPDAVSARALKHVGALQKRVQAGDRAVLVFCAQHTGIKRVRVAQEIDPGYAEAVRAAQAQGVEVVALGCAIEDCGTDMPQMRADTTLPFVAT